MIEKRKVDRKAKKKRKGIIFFIFLMIFFIFAMFAFKTNWFNIKSIEVEGNKDLYANQIVRISGNFKGENIFRLNTRKIGINLEKHPYIKKAEVKRKLPDKLVITILERKESFIIPYKGAYIYSDGEGVALKIEPGIDDENIPKVVGVDIKKPEIGEEILSKKGKHINEIGKTIKVVDEVNLLGEIEIIDFSEKGNINIDLKNGIKVAFGPLDNVKYKLSYLYSILDDISKKDLNCKYIYFNKGDNPIIVTGDK